MSLFKKIFKNKKGNTIKNTTVSQEVTQENQEKIIGLLNVREECTSEMFNSIQKYTTTRDALIKKSITQQNNISKEEGIEIINDFIENIAEQIPQGILVPIKTSFVYRGKSQVLFIGNKMLLAGKTLKANSTKPRQTLKEKQLVGFLLDFDEELNLFDQNNNSKITLSKERRPKIINLINEQLIDTKTENCRLGNIEITFSNWEESLESVIQIDDIDLINELLEYIVSLDYEITTGVTNFFNKKTEENEIELEKQKESVLISNINTISDEDSLLNDECHCEDNNCNNDIQTVSEDCTGCDCE